MHVTKYVNNSLDQQFLMTLQLHYKNLIFNIINTQQRYGIPRKTNVFYPDPYKRITCPNMDYMSAITIPLPTYLVNVCHYSSRIS